MVSSTFIVIANSRSFFVSAQLLDITGKDIVTLIQNLNLICLFLNATLSGAVNKVAQFFICCKHSDVYWRTWEKD